MPDDAPNPLDAPPAELTEPESAPLTPHAAPPAGASEDDLFDFRGAPPPRKPKSAPAARAARAAAPSAENAGGDEPDGDEASERSGAAAQPAPAAAPRWRGLVVAAFLGLHLCLLGAVVYVLTSDRKAPALPADPPAFVAPPPSGGGSAPIPGATPKTALPDAAPAAAADPRVRERLETADLLFSRGVYHDARRHYFEILLAPPPGNEGVAVERRARLRVAQALAREGATPLSPILLLDPEFEPGESR